MEELSEKYKTELEALKSERSRLIKEAKEEAQRITSEANKQIENTIRVIRESQADRDKTLIVRRKMEAFKQSLESEEPAVQDEAIDRKIEQIRQREQRRAEKRNKKRRPDNRRQNRYPKRNVRSNRDPKSGLSVRRVPERSFH